MERYYRKLARLLALCLAIVALPAAAQTDREVPAGSEPYVYQVETLNTGLSAGGEPLELDTPQALLESFFAAAEQGDWARAATALDMSNLSPRQQAQEGENLAAMMYEIANRSIAISWADLPDRPDAVDTAASNKNPMAGAERRHISLAHLDLGRRTVPISIARLQQPGGEPVWMFSRQSVGNLPELYERFGPSEFERSLPRWLREQAFWTLAWWEVIAIPIVLLLAFLAAALTYKAIGSWKKRCDDESVLGAILRAVQLPVTLLALAGSFAIMRNVLFTFSGPVEDLLGPLQLTLVVIAIGAILVTAVEAVLDVATDRNARKIEKPENESERDFYTQASAVRRLIIVLVMIAGLGIVLVQSNITQTLGFSLLAGAGVLGLVIAFAARKVLGDIMASMQIAFAKTARIGDAVQYEGQWCYVEKIGFTHLRLRTWDDRRVMAPVAEFVGSSFENWTKQEPALIMRIPINLDHRADIPALRERLMAFVEDADDIIKKDEAKLEVIDHTTTSMVARACVWATDPKSGWDMHCRLREYLLKCAAEMDAAAGNEPAPAFLPREREVQMDRAVEEQQD
ncbi:mechanosensitive ion channel family protein [Aurantiacibacter poecillastricola]|uniref:mechanosensitive ion channel family protein n=1 Tax=Aurantiacibacter poecillastricola TaxID=3064385 RepID=UPI00273F59F0|nr:mechanosensitive ion channel family protein [Aurantiacibacter sp. 219JJ12-13]MDP5263446.1 mechanosensitive ion channel family protein [Aurantiacibacter sp. 219JJ12-13]